MRPVPRSQVRLALTCAGPQVFYAGVIQRNGTNAQYHAVDSRIVGRKPTSVDFTEAAAWPLVVLTAWEMLEGHFGLVPHAAQKEEHTLLVVNGAGGVGSIATQLAKKACWLRPVGSAAADASPRCSGSRTSSPRRRARRRSTG
jgi:NADPH2:quinone reductase